MGQIAYTHSRHCLNTETRRDACKLFCCTYFFFGGGVYISPSGLFHKLTIFEISFLFTVKQLSHLLETCEVADFSLIVRDKNACFLVFVF